MNKFYHNSYSVNEGMDNEISFLYDTSSFMDICKNDKWIRIYSRELLEFLKKSDFLEQMGFRLEEIRKDK